MSDVKKRGPLSGVRVLDLSRILAGPYCSMMLADLGADVIKVEPPSGDDTRRFGPPFIEGESTYFLAINRGKRSICLDLKKPNGISILKRFVDWADVLLENFRPGVTKRLGIHAQALRAHKPSLIYASISGYGQEGAEPYTSLPGYDLVMQGVGGIAALTGPQTGDPYKVGTSIADIASGMNAFGAITAALYAREKTGVGQTIDISMLEGQLALLTYNASAWLNAGLRPKRLGNAHPSICPYEVFEAQNGYLSIACGNDAQFVRLAKILEQQEWIDDERFLSNALRVEHREILVAQMRDILSSETVEHWLPLLLDASVPAGPVLQTPEALAHPQVEARNVLVEHQHPSAGTVRTVGSALGYGEASFSALPPPLCGEHGEAVLRDVIGLGTEEIARLRQEGVLLNDG